MLYIARHKQIYDLIKDKGSVTVAELQDMFNVSLMTIRRDLQALSEEGLIVYPEFFFAQSKLSWGNAARDTKARIGQLAVAGALITAEMDRLLTAPNALERVGA